MNRSQLLTSVALLILICGTVRAQQDTNSAEQLYQARTFTRADGQQLRYRFLVPAGYSADGSEKYPLVLFLHGAGERGDDNTKQLVHGLKEFVTESNRKQYPCFVVAPQCPDGKRWVEVDWSADSHRQPDESVSLTLTRELLASLGKEFRVDDQRWYVTGLSMGGYGTWDLVTRTPELFAAAVPICGGADETLATRVVRVPLWVFHGEKDTAVKPERSRRMVAAIEKAGGMPKYTEYPGVGHNSWSQTYANPEVLAWLFAQKRP